MKVTIFTLIVVTAGVYSVKSGFVDFLCPSKSNVTLFDLCANDCKIQHGSFGGICGNPDFLDYNCYCGPLNVHRSYELYEKSLTCREPNEKYQAICNVDCLCSHGALFGQCDFQRRVCVCIGRDIFNIRCPMKRAREFGDFYIEQLGADSLPARLVEKIKKLE